MSTQNRTFEPIGNSRDGGISPRFNFDGFTVERAGGRFYGYTQLFRNGILESTKAPIARPHESETIIPAMLTEEWIIESFVRFMGGLRAAEVPPPL